MLGIAHSLEQLPFIRKRLDGLIQGQSVLPKSGKESEGLRALFQNPNRFSEKTISLIENLIKRVDFSFDEMYRVAKTLENIDLSQKAKDFIEEELVYLAGKNNSIDQVAQELKVYAAHSRVLLNSARTNFESWLQELKDRDLNYQGKFSTIYSISHIKDVDPSLLLDAESDLDKLFGELNKIKEIAKSPNIVKFASYCKDNGQSFTEQNYIKYFENIALKEHRLTILGLFKSAWFKNEPSSQFDYLARLKTLSWIDRELSTPTKINKLVKANNFFSEQSKSLGPQLPEIVAFLKATPQESLSKSEFKLEFESLLEALLYKTKHPSQEDSIENLGEFFSGISRRKHLPDFLAFVKRSGASLSFDQYKKYRIDTSVSPYMQDEVVDIFEEVQEALIDKSFEPLSREFADTLVNLSVTPTALTAFLNRIKADDITTQFQAYKEFAYMAGRLIIDEFAAAPYKYSGADLQDRESELHVIAHNIIRYDAPLDENANGTYENDWSGLVHLSDEGKQTISETFKILTQIKRDSESFGSLTFAARSKPDGSLPQLVDFANDVAHSLEYVEAQNIHGFPGRGFVISGINPDIVFDSFDLPGPMGDIGQANSKIQSGGIYYPEEIPNLVDTRFIVTRGLIAMTSSKDDRKFYIKDRDGQMTHYSYVFFNDHFHHEGQRALLVPTKILDLLFQASISQSHSAQEELVLPIANYQVQDVNEQNISPKKIFEIAERMGSNVLDIANPACFPAGLSKAFPAGKPPYDHWDDDNINFRAGVNIENYRDLSGHGHYWFLMNKFREGYKGKSFDQWRKAWKHAHNKVFKASEAYQNLFKLFTMGFAQWKKGQSFEALTKGQDYETNDITPMSHNRMLNEIFAWHSQRIGSTDDPNRFPILLQASAYDYAGMPQARFAFDTYDLSFQSIDSETGEISQRQFTEPELENFWNSPEFQYQVGGLGDDMRFYDRRAVNI